MEAVQDGTLESNFLYHTSCEKCGSSDANSVYDDGHSYCHSCNTYSHGDGAAPVQQRTHKRSSDLLYDLDYPAWRSRGLDSGTCRRWGIGTTKYKGKSVRVFQYHNASGVVAQKVRPASKKDMRFIGEPKEAWLYGQQLWRDKGKLVVVTEGEIDAASVSQAQNHKWPVVSIPNGAAGAKKSLQKAMEWLSGFETIVLMFDNDDAGQSAARECASLFRPGTCKIASLPLNDPNDMLKAGRGKEIIDAIWGAKTYRPDGIVLGSDLFDTISKVEDTFSLDYPWQGLQGSTLGCRLGEVVTITAGSGIGKSAVVRSLAHHLLVNHKEHVGMLMFEETVKRTALGLMGVHMKRPLTLMSNPAKEEGFERAFADTVGCGRLSLYDHFGSSVIDNVLDRIRYMAAGLGARWIFLDHLSILISGMEDGDERRLIDNAMTALKSLAMELNIGIFIVSHLKRPPMGKGHEDGAQTHLGQLRGSHAIAQLSDIVLGLERNQQDPKLKNITTMRILKNRFTGDTGICGWLRYSPETGTLEELLNEPTESDHGGVDTGDIF